MDIWEKLVRCTTPGEIKRMVEGNNWELVLKSEVGIVFTDEEVTMLQDWYGKNWKDEMIASVRKEAEEFERREK